MARDMIERRAPLWRTGLSWLFLLVFCLAAPTALITGWARLTVVSAEVYGSTMADIAADGRVQNAVGRVIAARVTATMSGENPTATEALQSRVVGEVVREAMRGVVESEEFRDTWEATNRGAHRLLAEELEARRGEPVVLDFSPLLDNIQTEVASLDLDLPPDFSLDATDLRIQVFDAGTADRIRLAVGRVDLVAWAALAITVLALILAIGLAPDRLAAIGRAGFGLAIAMLALIALIVIAQHWLMSETGAEGGADVAGVILDAVSQGLRVSAIGLALLGLLLAGLCAGLRALRGST
ncbi:MAG: hypothetical protein ACRDJC_13975 [Thermomicrobiales bacterium]